MDRYQKRVLRLREHVLKQQSEKNDLTEQPTNEDNEDANIIDIDDIKKDKIIKILTQKGIEHNPRDRKEILYELMIKGE